MEASKVYTPQSLDQSFENSDSEDKDTNLMMSLEKMIKNMILLIIKTLSEKL